MGNSGGQRNIPAEDCVHAEWVSRLPGDRQQLFRDVVVSLEATYTMMSVALDEAMRLRSNGQLVQAREQAGVCGELGERLAWKVGILIRGMKEHGGRMSALPVVLPLTASNFRHSDARMAAALQWLLHKLLLSTRLRFFHKLRVLQAAVDGLTRQFKTTSKEIAENQSVEPRAAWQELDHLHYDLNTCLREAIVVMKCFLRGMSEERFAVFQQQLRGIPTSPAEEQATKLAGTKSAQHLSAQLITPVPPRY
ncbi:MAG: hypothetical protein HY234_15645 [Acidobacteria bacterium]|nr:hypothetical protein [Acidobacteriota bacterium]MBI3664468.1 hypothetical protein [Acidobacteriota bacterium]